MLTLGVARVDRARTAELRENAAKVAAAVTVLREIDAIIHEGLRETHARGGEKTAKLSWDRVEDPELVEWKPQGPHRQPVSVRTWRSAVPAGAIAKPAVLGCKNCETALLLTRDIAKPTLTGVKNCETGSAPL